jgi:cytochrome oxidase assembly protein ShyY1|tara:strand:+ start:33497 stop:34246 length:750 start_codon:yes stop_codon:yes gene_type:complete
MTNNHSQTTTKWNPGWKLTAFVLFFLPILVTLAFWQLDRAEEKRQIIANEQYRRAQLPVALGQLDVTAAASYISVLLTGKFDNEKPFLLDNQQYRSRFGYEIISPFFDLNSNQTVLISRGWVQGSLDRSELPALAKVTGLQSLEVEIYVPLGKPFLLAEQTMGAAWPKVIQAVEVDKMAASLGSDVFPYVLRLKEANPGVYERHWQVVNVPVHKHTGYAVQWFVMAIVLVGLYVATGLGKFGHKDKEQD